MPMKFHKSTTNRMLFGVCGGLGKTLKVDARYVRIGFILLHLLTRLPLFLIYLLLAYFLPFGTAEDGDGGEAGGFRSYSPPKDSGNDDGLPFDISDAKDVEIERQEE